MMRVLLIAHHRAPVIAGVYRSHFSSADGSQFYLLSFNWFTNISDKRMSNELQTSRPNNDYIKLN